MTNIEIRERTEKLWRELPHCCGYPKCDGDLEGEAHSEECPLFNQKPKQLWEFMLERIAAERDAAIEECCKDVCQCCRDKEKFTDPINEDGGDWWLHRRKADNDGVVCRASAIRSRVAAKGGSR